MERAPRVDHVTLTIGDLKTSSAWYRALFGAAETFTLTGPGWQRQVLYWPGGLAVGLTEYAATTAGDAFDHTRVGLDHLGLACRSSDEVRAWAARMDELGVVHGPVEEVPYGWAVTARDPDGIAVEFFCLRS